MNNIKSYSEFVSTNQINEDKSIENKIKNISRHLAFDKDVIKYLNTTRSKREIGWRDLLNTKLLGSDKNYINYITKNMVANHNSKITGPISVHVRNNDDDSSSIELDTTSKNTSLSKQVASINNRLEDVENVLGIDPDDSDTLIAAMDKAKELGFDTIERENEEDEEDNEEE